MTEDSRSALSRGDSPDYVDAILKYLGDRQPMDVFPETAEALRAAVRALSDKQLRTPETSGKWSVLEVLWHLADVEIVLGLRYRKALAEPGQPYPAIDQDAWVKALGYESRDAAGAIDDFEAVRGTNLRLLRSLDGEQWQRFGLHEERGKETLEHMVRLYAAHDLYHLFQIDRIMKAIGV